MYVQKASSSNGISMTKRRVRKVNIIVIVSPRVSSPALSISTSTQYRHTMSRCDENLVTESFQLWYTMSRSVQTYAIITLLSFWIRPRSQQRKPLYLVCFWRFCLHPKRTLASPSKTLISPSIIRVTILASSSNTYSVSVMIYVDRLVFLSGFLVHFILSSW